MYAVGPITTGKSEADPFGSEVMGSTTIVEALREANKDKDVAAIVLRIDSPGGSALASDLIWHETQVIKKPIVASMGDVAGSGGYYIAMGTDKIIADARHDHRLDRRRRRQARHPRSVQEDRHHHRNDRARPQQRLVQLERAVHRFGARSRPDDDGRHLRPVHDEGGRGSQDAARQARKLAGGRVYTGRQALANGLVDQLGTLHDAIQEAKQLAGIDKDTKVTIESLPEPTNFFESLFGEMDEEKEVRTRRGARTARSGAGRCRPQRPIACKRFSAIQPRRW